ncbi:hypothetical protein MA47_02940 [Corynebacterium auriscanis]|uniref:Uncharacterized protein n=1 Tax=Corynebacterium auriscanis TaxID=99807 RepID=A0A0A2DIX8_9CORY|nr:hypothetical protein MA47_02940 [Corynebacterium auriscanis]
MLASVENTSLGVKVLYSRRSSGGQVARALGFVPAARWASCWCSRVGFRVGWWVQVGRVPVFARWASCRCSRVGPRASVFALGRVSVFLR